MSQLESKNADLERFTYTVSHDLKTPLFTINSFLGMMEQDLKNGKNENVQDCIDRIHSAARKMKTLMDQLLELSRVGTSISPEEKISMYDVVHEAVELVRGPILKRGVKVNISSNLPSVTCDRIRFIEVIQNLVDNAVKYTENQSEPRIDIGVIQDSDPVIYFVRDNGIGLDSLYYKKVFNLFERLDPSTEGTGIGLTLVKRIVELHGGRVWVESEGPGNGTTFYFTLWEKGALIP